MLDFIVLGAQKAGTSTLHELLAQSSEVALPWTKETHFFRDEEKFLKGVEWYRKQFKDVQGNVKVYGEIDPEYMYFPECIERIGSICDTPKLIIVLREPISRALSHYRMSQRRGYEPLTFYDALVEESARLEGGDRFSQIHHSYIGRGLYAEQIERITSQLPDSELLVLKFDDLYTSQDSAVKTLNTICDFIGISSNGITVDVTLKHNKAAVPRFNGLRDLVYGQGKVKKLVGKFIPSRDLKIRMMKFIDRVNMKPADKSQSEAAQCPYFVYEKLINDLYKLRMIADIDVSHWIESYYGCLEKR
ncbi:sulfotransferase domain-containing protein [Thiohalomonas denitrificans]|uniref:Sulfotransferase domain-containing protein n=1 Tax=Thiohalomonas denitrificans TaxID=415747 RepID=A0A1G5R0C7_9GAMM|nr:sulfotransferase domain-containing protein [Thiohalomonas denitrificans]SCZ67298.1 Sulfotransferase domain-containing protein [Thiohalomonas denitrificans]